MGTEVLSLGNTAANRALRLVVDGDLPIEGYLVVSHKQLPFHCLAAAMFETDFP